VLRALANLRTLDVAKLEPAFHSMTSMQALFNLVEAFCEEGQSLHVNLNPALSVFHPAELRFFGFME